MSTLKIVIYMIVAIILLVCRFKETKDKIDEQKGETPPPLPPKPPKKQERSYRLHDFSTENEEDYLENYTFGAYIQNNNDIIEKTMAVHNPKFRSVSFINWAMSIIRGIAENGVENSLSVMSDNFKSDNGDICDIKQGSVVNMNYLSLYRLENGIESLTLCLAFSDDDVESIDELNALSRYFAVFERKSQYDKMTDGEYKKISCPHCGGELDISNEAKCPYCGQIILKSEEDWHLASFKKLAEGTRYTNVGVVIKKQEV